MLLRNLVLVLVRQVSILSFLLKKDMKAQTSTQRHPILPECLKRKTNGSGKTQTTSNGFGKTQKQPLLPLRCPDHQLLEQVASPSASLLRFAALAAAM